MDSVDYYNKYANLYFDSTVNLDLSEILKRFMEYLEPGDTVLDLGCGSGRDSKIMLENGLEVILLDASQELCELADIYTGVEPLCMDFREMDFHEVFQGIWACASLLHVGKNEIEGILNQILAALKPGGTFYMSVKKGSFEGFRRERYFADYSVEELQQLFQRIPEFRLIDIWETEDVRIARNQEKWLNVLAVRRTDLEAE